MKVIRLFMVLLAVVVLASCSSKPGTPLQANIDTGNASTFDPANGVVPFPDDLLFNGSTDGTLNIPIPSGTPASDPRYALNALDGFSTNAPISTGFDAPIDSATVSASSVRMFEVAAEYPKAPGGAVVAINSELSYGTDFVAKVSSFDPTQLIIVPLKPLKPKTSYEVVITNALKDTQGNSMLPSTTYALAKDTNPYYTLPSGPRASNLPAGLAGYSDADLANLEQLRELIATSEATTVAFVKSSTFTTSNIIMSWGFTTQSIDDVLLAVHNYDDTQLATINGAFSNPSATIGFGAAAFGSASPTVSSPLGLATIEFGFLKIPYFLTAPTSVNDTADLYKHWQGPGNTELTQYNPMPVVTSTQAIPMLVSIPKVSSGGSCSTIPAGGWPVVIFQHGITRNRTDMLGVADALANICMASVAIDLPLHGLTGNESDPNIVALYQATKALGLTERTFNLDVLTQDSTGAVTANSPDNITDTSGSNFINLSNLLETRDNLRQGISDLFVLVNNIKNGAVTDGTNTLNPNKIYFLGHSLGAIVGTPFLALEPNVGAAVLANGGSDVAKILDGSATFGPVIASGLAAAGINKGTSDYESFMGAAQTVMDSADPVNYSLNAPGYGWSAANPLGGANPRGLLFFEVVGDPANSVPSDLVVPNKVPDSNDTSGTIAAPLAGTDPQLALLGLTQVNASTTATSGDLLVDTKFTAGDHGSVLDPASNQFVTQEMQAELASFFASDGLSLQVSTNTYLQTPP